MVALVLGDGEHHDATIISWNFCYGDDRTCSLRLYPHAETEKEPLSKAHKVTRLLRHATRRGGSRRISPSCGSYCRRIVEEIHQYQDINLFVNKASSEKGF